MTYIEDDITAKLSLALFRQLFESDNDFNEYNDKKANYINLLIDKLNAKGKDEKEEAEDDIESEIVTILFNIKKKDDKNLMKNLIIKLKKQLEINSELYYLLFVLLVETGFNLHILIDYLPQILKEKYPDSTFDFSDVFKTDMKFEEFVQIFFSAIDSEKNYDYATFKFNNKTKTILISHKSIDEIANIILSASNEKKKKDIKKSNKEKDFESKTENKILDKKKKESNTDHQQRLEITNEGVSEEKDGENIQYLNEKGKIDNTGNIGNDKKEKSDEGKYISMEEVRKIINENIQKCNEELGAKIDKLVNDNKQLENDNKQLKNDNMQLKNDIKQLKNGINQLEFDKKNLNKKIKDINCSLSNKIMQNKKKITSLEFDLKTIGLRDAYKSFIDLLIFIMNLDVHGNLETKISSISNALKNLQNKNVEKIRQLLNDTSDLLTHVNNKAHFINFKEDIIKQLILNLSKFSGNKEYLSIIDILKKLKIENELEKLVKNRVEKFKKSKEDFIKNQQLIKESIQENNLIAKGKGFNTLLNS